MRATLRALSLALIAGTAAIGAARAETPAAKPAGPPAVQSAVQSTAAVVEPEARQALERMGAYLATLRTFEVATETSLDVVTQSGQRVQLDGSASYKVRRPDAFVISVNSDWKKRTYYYDGKQFVAYAPELGFYATSAAPPTILQTLDAIHEQYGIALPIEDLFRWGDPKTQRGGELQIGFDAGTATIDGVKTNHYVFRQGDADWQVWIEDGDRPLPRKLVIIDRTDPAFPAYTARLTWTLNPTFSADTFAFRPSQTAKAIKFASLDAEK